jgi:hypothetical protein
VGGVGLPDDPRFFCRENAGCFDADVYRNSTVDPD